MSVDSDWKGVNCTTHLDRLMCAFVVVRVFKQDQ